MAKKKTTIPSYNVGDVVEVTIDGATVLAEVIGVTDNGYMVLPEGVDSPVGVMADDAVSSLPEAPEAPESPESPEAPEAPEAPESPECADPGPETSDEEAPLVTAINALIADLDLPRVDEKGYRIRYSLPYLKALKRNKE